MEKIISILKLSFSFLATGFIYCIGGIDSALESLIIIMLIDYITGVFSAIKNKKLSSKIGFEGILKKIIYLFIICLTCVIDRMTLNDGSIRSLVIYWLIANDGISILENVAEFGIPVPAKIKDMLIQLKGGENMEEKEVIEVKVDSIEEVVAEEVVAEEVPENFTREIIEETVCPVGIVGDDSDEQSAE